MAYLSNTPTNLCTPLYCILLYCVVLNCIVLLIYCYVDIIQYNGVHKFVGVLDNPPQWRSNETISCRADGNTLSFTVSSFAQIADLSRFSERVGSGTGTNVIV